MKFTAIIVQGVRLEESRHRFGMFYIVYWERQGQTSSQPKVGKLLSISKNKKIKNQQAVPKEHQSNASSDYQLDQFSG